MTENQIQIKNIIKSNGPISAPGILKILNNKINKTTVYRNISSMIEGGDIKEVRINSQKSFYELANLPHHHHFVCEDCGDIEEISSQELEKNILKIEKKLQSKGMKIKRHDLEFYGNCVNCN